LEKALSVTRRSVFFIDENFQSEDLFKNLSNIDEVSDENIVQAVAKTLSDKESGTRRIDALSLEVTPKLESGISDYAVTFKQTIRISDTGDIVNITEPDTELIVADIFDEILDNTIAAAENSREMELYFYHPLANKEDITKMTDTFLHTRSSLTTQAERLKAAMKIILLMAAKQIVVSYRKILTEESERLASGACAEEVSRDTCLRCLNVTETVAEMAVEYLKNATRNVVDTSVNDVKIILGRMGENDEIEEIQNEKIEFEEMSRL